MSLPAAVRELRFAARSLGRSPLLLLTSQTVLAVAIGASAAAFSVLDAVRFRALPFRDAERLIVISETLADGGDGDCGRSCSVSWETYADQLRNARLQTIDGLAPYTAGGKSLRFNGDAVLVSGGITTPLLFELMGVSARIGRTFTDEDDRLGVPLVALLSHDMWTRRDPLVYATVALLTLGVSLLASGIPAWRASRVDPPTALRDN